MTVLLAADEYCYKYGNEYYLEEIGMMHINRLLMVYDKVRGVYRTEVAKTPEQLVRFNIKIDDPRIEIWPIEFFRGPKQFARLYGKIRKQLRGVAEGCELGVLRVPSTTSFAVWLKLRRKKVPFATEVVFDSYDGYKSSKGLLKPISYILHRMQFKSCQESIGVSCVTARYLQQHYYPKSKDALTTNYSSIDLKEEYLYQARQYPARRFFTIAHVACQVMYNSRKGHAELVKIAKILNDRGYDVQVKFAGEDYMNGFQQLTELASSLGIKDKVCFAGFLSSADLRQMLIESDVVVLPTKAEGLPRVIIEAMALGLPCITTGVSGNPELIDRPYLFDFSDVEGMAGAIEALISSPELYEEASRTNFERSKQYTKRVLDARRKSFYEGLKVIVRN